MGKNNIKILKYLGCLIVFGLLAYHSVYVRPLDKIIATTESNVFDPKAYARNFWRNQLPAATGIAVDVVVLLDLMRRDMPRAVESYSNTLGVASKHAYLIKGAGRISGIDDTGILVDLNGETGGKVLLVTVDLFGNAVRDASGLVDVSDFTNSMEFNTISVEINRIVRTDVVQPALEQASIGNTVRFVGAAEVGEEDPEIHPLRLIPIEITMED